MSTSVNSTLRPAIGELEDSLIRRISDAAMGRDGVIPLWFGEPDLPTPKFINDAAGAALAAGHTFYLPNRGLPELCQALSGYMTRLHGIEVGTERITVTNSGMHAIMLTMQALVDPGDNVIVPMPLWPNCAETVRVMGGEARRVAMDLQDGTWALDLGRVLDACDGRTRAVFINSPSNPTGWIMPADEQRELLAACRARGIYVVADEVYNRIVFDRAQAPSFIDIADADDSVIVVNSFSKSWLMTGWRLGWLTHPPELGRVFAMLNEFNLAGPPTFIQHAGIVAREQGDDLVGEIVSRYRANRDVVHQRLAALPRVRITRPPGAFYAFFSVDGMDDSVAFATDLVDRVGVGLAPGRAFGPAGEGYLRLCFASRPDTLSSALERLAPGLA